MKLIVGLGNPGKKYKNNRHNVGFMFVDKANRLKFPKDVSVFKTGVFMNESGAAVKKLLSKQKVNSGNLYIVHDDLDIPLGSFKVQFGKGPKDHNGILSINQSLGTEDYWRIRVGVDKRDPQERILGEEYVLEDFTISEREVIEKVLGQICKKLATS